MTELVSYKRICVCKECKKRNDIQINDLIHWKCGTNNNVVDKNRNNL